MSYIQPRCRHQLTLPQSLDDYVSLDNPVRLIDAFLERFVTLYPHSCGDKGSKSTGRSAYLFSSLCKLYVYGYLNSISSSRKLERETYRNLEVIWLLGDLHPDHKTISDFRSSNKASIHEVCVSFRRFLVDNDYISGKLVATDGTKIKANASLSTLSLSAINRRLATMKSNLDKYLEQLNENDIVETAQEQLSELSDELGVETSLLQKIAELSQEVQTLREQQKYLQDNDRENVSLADPQAKLMKTKYGFLPAYNVQSVVDAENHMIGAMIVTDHPNDYHDLQNNINTFKDDLGITPTEIVADAGYANEEQITALQEDSIVAVPFAESKLPSKGQQPKENFSFDATGDYYLCSQGHKLTSKGNVTKRGKRYRKYQGKECNKCPLQNLCTKSKKGRIIYRRLDDTWIKGYHLKLKTDAFKKLIKLRKSIVEHPFGTLKYWMGQIPILLRGKEKVQVEIDLYATSYNLKRLINLESVDIILNKIQNWA